MPWALASLRVPQYGGPPWRRAGAGRDTQRAPDGADMGLANRHVVWLQEDAVRTPQGNPQGTPQGPPREDAVTSVDWATARAHRLTQGRLQSDDRRGRATKNDDSAPEALLLSVSGSERPRTASCNHCPQSAAEPHPIPSIKHRDHEVDPPGLSADGSPDAPPAVAEP